MTVFKRFGFFSIGLIMGLIILVFFLSGKKTSCDYFPNARVLKDIRTKERSYEAQSLSFLNEHKIDTSEITTVLKSGSVNFRESITDKDSCNIFTITGEIQNRPVKFKVENCDSLAKIYNLDFYTEK